MRLTSLIAAAALVAASVPADARNNAGAYLAARQAGVANDFSAAAQYYTRALSLDPGNTLLMENVILANIGMGWIDRAIPVAQRLVKDVERSQIANLVLLSDLIRQEQFTDIMTGYAEGLTVGPLVDGLVKAWAGIGAGDTEAALAQFDEVSEESGLKSFALYHKALAYAVAGDFEAADGLLSGEAAGQLALPRRGVVAHVQILSQLDRPEDAVALIEEAFGAGTPPPVTSLRDQIEAGATLDYNVVTNSTEGLAEVFFSVAGALYGEAAHSYTLIYSRVAEHLDPRNVDAKLLSASLLENLDQYELATRAYDEVPPESPSFIAAELGRADALLSDERNEAAIEVLNQLAKQHPDLHAVQVALGDSLRSLERFEEATPAYDRAIQLIETPERQHWTVYFSRGVTLERTDRWEEAEKDFRFALELEPNQPQVLNYLGYSLVELQVKLDEALDMIERAVAGRPNDGYITDSLGWVLYRLGRYDEAVEHMERAAELMPVDPIINDHLGDVYWAVGRELEAQFQWRRALSFDPEPEEAERIRRKLEVGLDVVLEEEGAEPLAVAEDG